MHPISITDALAIVCLSVVITALLSATLWGLVELCFDALTKLFEDSK